MLEMDITGSIPNLKFDLFAIHIDSPDFEIYAYGCDKGGCELVFTESQ